ncbi:HES1B factor, partial [Todus mexicanus]|nr:HES1B factor [Todus mexicanus]
MPADLMEKSSASPVAATPASVNATPDKPRTAAEHRKRCSALHLDPRHPGAQHLLPEGLRSPPGFLAQRGCRMQHRWAAHARPLRSLLTAVCLSPSTAALSTDPTVLGKYRAGFSECMNEVTRFLSTCEGVNTEVRTRLLGHLASCMTQINAMNYPPPPPPPPLPPAAAFGPPLVPPGSGAGPLPGMPCKPGTDAAKVYGGFQLLPASDGQFAFLIPSTAFAPGGAVLPLYGGPPTAATAASPPGPPPGTADSVWRPW